MLGLIVSGTFFGSGKRLSGEVVPPVREGGEIYGRSTGRQTGTRHATCTFAHITADSTFTQFNADVCTMKRRRTKAGAASPGRAAPAAAAAVAAVLLAFLFQSSTAVAAAGAAAATWQSRAGGPAGQMLHAIRFVPQGVAEAAAAATQNAACKRSKKLAGREHIVRGARSSSQAAGAGSPTAGKDRKRFLQRQQEPVPTVDRAASRTTTQRGRPLALWRRFDRRSKLSPAGRLDDDAAEPHVLYAAAAGNDGYDGEETASDPQRQGSSTSEAAAKRSRGGGEIHLNFREALMAGAVSRSIAHTCVHPAIVVKTLMQGRGTSSQLSNLSLKLLRRGVGAQFVMSLPHGAFNYATLEVIMGFSAKIFPREWRERAGPVLDFVTSGVATLLCSVISTPQIVIEDRIMTGMYPNLISGVRELSRTEGLRGFYTGWSANVSQKIPSYGLTWVFYQASKRLYKRVTHRAPTATESFALGAAAAGGAVCVVLPLDAVLTRVVTQRAQVGFVPYKGVVRTLSRIIKEEGLGSMYGSLPAKLVSVVPAIGIQFGIYDYFRKQLIRRKRDDGEGDGLLRDGLLPPSVRRRLGLGNDGRGGDDSDDDVARKLYLLEEELL